ncbi:MAG: hypothetical protein HYU36_02945 [Planctomycetes bacterium]|nr:hypothetical protein [Planctomycetota bacterium]
MRGWSIWVAGTYLFGSLAGLLGEDAKPMTQKDYLELMIRETKPLKHPRGDRLPLYLWSSRISGMQDEAEIERIVKALDERGIGVFCSWNPGDVKGSLAESLRVARIQQKLGLLVNVDGTGVTGAFFNGDEPTAHVGEDGKPFFDMSFAGYVKMGCPFALQHRYEPIRKQVETFVKGYQEAGVSVDYWAADWEIDGPIEWNDGWKNSKQCKRCRDNIKNIGDFSEFQAALRRIRSHMQNEVFCKTILGVFPKALVANYAMNPHDGYRYWYDWFEKPVEGAPCRKDQNACYRKWPAEFESSGYTCAMPVVYAWSPIYNSYTFENGEYRWFYNMLLEATSVGRSAPASLPVIPFVHFTPIKLSPQDLPEGYKPLSEANYKELLWHMLLRGHDTFCMWCPNEELVQETRPLHEVYAASLQYREFLDQGKPVLFRVPSQTDTVVSALKLGNRLLVRRTDFGPASGPVEVEIEGRKISVPAAPGQCQTLEIR